MLRGVIMPLDLCLDSRSQKGRVAFHKGMAAEKSVALAYDRRGADLLNARWRGQGGEIDLIFEDHGVVVFCEVKAARDAETAMGSLQSRQIERIHMAAAEYMGQLPDGQLAEVRFDLAVVDGQGVVTVLENAFGHF